jgi:predicted NAD/FAD-binding protein
MRIAIVGAGVSGLVAAHLLHRAHDITVFEAGAYAGGHTNTVRVDTADHTHWVDTGFIVYNDRTYPNFIRLLDVLGVASQRTHMGFSVSGESEDFEYAGTPRGLFCQPVNALRPRFWRMIGDLVRFNRALEQLLSRDVSADDPSLGELLSRGGYSRAFVQRLIVPQVSAVWSAQLGQVYEFPARFLAEFLANHGMLSLRDRPRWFTISGGSARYVEALTRPFADRLRLNAAVASVTRDDSGVDVRVAGSDPQRFDQVVIATHSDQALSMLSDASEHERSVLGALSYQPNEAVLHTDSTLLPRRRAARQAWNFHLLDEPKPLTTVTYYMNHLQRLDADRDFCVTLNHTEAIDPAKIVRTIHYSHPVYTQAGVCAQREQASISGVRRTHYCGAYWGWGFHEDGVLSAQRACAPFGVKL